MMRKAGIRLGKAAKRRCQSMVSGIRLGRAVNRASSIAVVIGHTQEDIWAAIEEVISLTPEFMELARDLGIPTGELVELLRSTLILKAPEMADVRERLAQVSAALDRLQPKGDEHV